MSSIKRHGTKLDTRRSTLPTCVGRLAKALQPLLPKNRTLGSVKDLRVRATAVHGFLLFLPFADDSFSGLVIAGLCYLSSMLLLLIAKPLLGVYA